MPLRRLTLFARPAIVPSLLPAGAVAAAALLLGVAAQAQQLLPAEADAALARAKEIGRAHV